MRKLWELETEGEEFISDPLITEGGGDLGNTEIVDPNE
jgi:hypothetical protein